MLTSPDLTRPVYGMITTGGSFVFLKLLRGANETAYGLSRIFEMQNPGNDLYTVLAVLKRLQQLILDV
jgi:hypothetical protein